MSSYSILHCFLECLLNAFASAELLKSNLLRKWSKIGMWNINDLSQRVASYAAIGVRRHDIERICKLEFSRIISVIFLAPRSVVSVTDLRRVPCKIFVNQLWVIRKSNVTTCLEDRLNLFLVSNVEITWSMKCNDVRMCIVRLYKHIYSNFRDIS